MPSNTLPKEHDTETEDSCHPKKPLHFRKSCLGQSKTASERIKKGNYIADGRIGLQGQRPHSPGLRPGRWVTQKEIAPYRGRIIKRVLKVLPLQGDDVVLLPTQGNALGQEIPPLRGIFVPSAILFPKKNGEPHFWRFPSGPLPRHI